MKNHPEAEAAIKSHNLHLFKGEAKDFRLLPNRRRRRQFLRHSLLPRHTAQAGPRYAGSATTRLRRQSYPAHCIDAEQSPKFVVLLELNVVSLARLDVPPLPGNTHTNDRFRQTED